MSRDVRDYAMNMSPTGLLLNGCWICFFTQWWFYILIAMLECSDSPNVSTQTNKTDNAIFGCNNIPWCDLGSRHCKNNNACFKCKKHSKHVVFQHLNLKSWKSIRFFNIWAWNHRKTHFVFQHLSLKTSARTRQHPPEPWQCSGEWAGVTDTTVVIK